MIEKVIDNWLTKASEKSYQVPFAFMLTGEGHTLLHITRHCSMEYGKDIITVDNNGIPHAYQLKGTGGGRYSKSNYREGLSQLWELVTVPVTHPSLKGNVLHRPFLVVNGDIDEEAVHAIESQNKNWTPPSTANYFIWLNENGQNEVIFFPDKVSWKQLIQEINNIDDTKVPNVFKKLPNWTPLFLMTYPHRFITEICLFYQNRLLEKMIRQGTTERKISKPDCNN